MELFEEMVVNENIFRYFLFFLVISFPMTLIGKDISKSTALLSVYKQPVDFDFPWKRGRVLREKHLAIFCKIPKLDFPVLLTTAQAITDSVKIDLQLFGNNKLYTSEVIFQDREANLAILRIPKKINKQDISFIPIGSKISLRDQVYIFESKSATSLNSHDGHLQLSKVEISKTGSYPLLHYAFKVQRK